MLAHVRRCTTLALVAALLALTGATSASAQEPDRDGDAYPDSADQCPDQPYNGYPGGAYGCPGTDPSAGDYDRDGVADAQDACPYEGAGATGGLTNDGCPDADRDGSWDQKDGCPAQPTNEYSSPMYGEGCPGRAPFSEPDTPPASGRSCPKKQPCIVLERRGLSEMKEGGYIDDDATVKVTIARDARGVPARVVDVELRNLDSSCVQYDEQTRQYSSTPGPEVSTTLDSLALKKRRQRHGGGGFSTVFRFDPMSPVRTIKGLKYQLGFYMAEDDDASEAQFSISAADARPGDCTINIYGNNDPVSDGVCRGAVQDDERGTCAVVEGQEIDHVYDHGQALHFDCGVSFACPVAKNVDVKVTVIKSVAKALGLKSTTISDGKAVGPKRTKLNGEKGTYYFVPLAADVARRMKAKKVRSVTVTVSGAATGRDGVRRFSPTRVQWLTDGNCGGRDFEMQKHLEYGGRCSGR